jgi:hypothetical protein
VDRVCLQVGWGRGLSLNHRVGPRAGLSANPTTLLQSGLMDRVVLQVSCGFIAAFRTLARGAGENVGWALEGLLVQQCEVVWLNHAQALDGILVLNSSSRVGCSGLLDRVYLQWDLVDRVEFVMCRSGLNMRRRPRCQCLTFSTNGYAQTEGL